MKPSKYSGYPSDRDEAKRRFEAALDDDPLPEISSALLTSGHFREYAREVGLIYPFKPDDSGFAKTTSYAGHVGERIFCWSHDQDGPVKNIEKVITRLEKGESFLLPKFGLAYVETEEEFFLPHYIAARFNLGVDLVHWGLLLGTGPMVDPGFSGKLLIPIHNLTGNQYRITGGQRLIWIEFTKTSICKDISTQKFFNPYPPERRGKDVVNFINAARGYSAKDHVSQIVDLKSGIPTEISSVGKTARAADRTARRAELYIFGYGVVAALAAVFGIGSFLQDVVNSKQDVLSRLQSGEEKVNAQQIRLERFDPDQTKVRVNNLDDKLRNMEIVSGIRQADTESKLKRLESQIESLRSQISQTPSAK